MQDENFISAVKQELSQLRAELAGNPIQAKIRALEGVVSLYEARAKSGAPEVVAQPAAGRPESKKALILQNARIYIMNHGGEAPRKDLVTFLTGLGLLTGKNPKQVLAKILSEAPNMKSDGKGTWRVAE